MALEEEFEIVLPNEEVIPEIAAGQIDTVRQIADIVAQKLGVVA